MDPFECNDCDCDPRGRAETERERECLVVWLKQRKQEREGEWEGKEWREPKEERTREGRMQQTKQTNKCMFGIFVTKGNKKD